MRSLQQWKQRKLNLGPVADVLPSRSSEEFIASHLSESPTGQIRLIRGEAALYKIAVRFYIHWKTIKRFRERVSEITTRRRGRSLPQVIDELKQFMNGWWNYYGITESFNRLRPLPHWIRRRLRALVWKHWKNRKTRVRELLKRGIFRNYAVTTGCARKGPWRMSKVKWVQIALPDAYFTSLGLLFPWI